MVSQEFADLDAARRERNRNRQPVQFSIGDEVFTCIAVVPVGVAFDLAAAPELGDNRGAATYALITFVDQLLIEEDRARFADRIRRRDDPVDPEFILDLVARISQEYAARPTLPSSGSSSGRATDGPNSSSTPSPSSAASSST